MEGNGKVAMGLTFHSKNPIVWAIVTIAVAAIDGMQDTPLQTCAAAMAALNCPQGFAPYMNFDEGGWFSGATCNVGCRK